MSLEEVKQLLEYNSQEELIKWLEWNLYQQRKSIISKTNKGYNASSFNNDSNRKNEYLKTIIDNKLLTLNLGSFHKNITINFIFDFDGILIHLGHNEEDEYRNIICPYIVNCRRVTFVQDACFFSVIFTREANFSSSTFTREANFSSSTFESKISFESIKFENTMSFNYINLNDKSYINFYNINYDRKNKKFIKNENSKIEIINTTINGRIDFYNVSVYKIDFKGTVVIGTGVISTDELNVNKYATWKTARFLKHEAYKISNTIEALKYKAIEKELYAKELIEKTDKTLQTWAEIFSLWISKVSNNHGQNWIRAVAFTLISGFFFFTLSIIPIGITKYLYILLVIYLTTFIFEDIYKYVINTILIYMILFWFVPFLYETLPNIHKIITNYADVSVIDFFAYFVPTNFDPIIPSKNDPLLKYANEVEKFFSYSAYIMGKIAIGYGIFEIIQAFRKFNSKG